MRLKLFRAAGVAEAMASVRTELGADALILATRRVADGIEITAALEQEDAPAPVHDLRRAETLRQHNVPDALARKLEAGPLAFALSVALRFSSLDLEPGGKPLLLTGPPGAGKTLTVARLATRLVLAGAVPMVITADGRRAGAAEQLAAFTRLLGVNLIVASLPSTLARALGRRQDDLPVLIDTPGCDPFDRAQGEELEAMASAVGATIALVLPAGLDPGETAELSAAFAERGAVALIATRLDLARRLGGVLAAGGAGLSFTEAGIGPGAADGLVRLTPDFLAARLTHSPPHRERRP